MDKEILDRLPVQIRNFLICEKLADEIIKKREEKKSERDAADGFN